MLYLIDASIYVFRAYYSMPGSITDGQGNPVNAVYGFCSFLTDFIQQTNPDFVGVAFDISLTSSFRNDLYPQYKANRDPAPDELKRQFIYCRRIAAELGMPCFADSTCEADDIIGTLATKWREKNRNVTIVSRDKDLMQLIKPGDIYWDYASDKRIEHQQIKEHFGVEAERVADYLALTGDAVDNIPGVPGIGKKTASVIFDQFESLEDLYDNLDSVHTLNVRGAKSLQKKLVDHKATAQLAKQLTLIKLDMPLSAAKESLQRTAPDMAALEKTFDELGFSNTLRNKVQKLV